jgi:hypothetical protein
MAVQRTDDFLRPRGYYDNQGNLLKIGFDVINALPGDKVGQTVFDSLVVEYTTYVNKHKALAITNPVTPISLDQYIAYLKMEFGYLIGNNIYLSNITGLPAEITSDYMVTIFGGCSYAGNPSLYYATMTVESMTGGHIKYFGQIYNSTIFTGWKKIITSNDVPYGAGSPEGAVTASIGTLYRRTDGGANTTLYVKESGTGNTGWIAK